MNNEKKYYYKLDIIRAISCLLILFYHLNILKGGFLAVCTFFVLSGYLTCFKALENSNFSLKKYYLNRFKKIYLPLLIVIAFTLIFYKYCSNINWLNLKKETISAIFGYNNFWQIDASLNYFTKHISSPFIHLWFISILIQFDLIFPILFLMFKKIDQKASKHFSTFFIFLLTITSTVYFIHLSHNTNIMFSYYNSFARLFSILFGVFLAIIHYKYSFKISNLFKPLCNYIFVLYIILLIIPCFFVSAKSSNYAIWMIIITLISTRLIEYAATKEQDNKIFKITKFISRNSYEIYLVQYPVIFFMQAVKTNDILKTILIIIITIIISWIINSFINIKTKNKLIKSFAFIVYLIIISFGAFIFINEKDNTKELKELESKLDENLKIIEEKNQEYLNNLNVSKDEWNKTLESLEVNEEEIANIVSNLPVVGIGDSVLLGAIDGLYQKFPNGYFDGKVSRTIVKAEDIIIDLKNQGKLPDTLILALANNGDYSDYINRGLMEIVGNRQVYWVTAVLADDPAFNDRFREFAKNYPNVHIVEWEEASKNHPEYFYADGIHVKEEGVPAYAQVIYDAIYNNYLAEYENKKQEKIREHENELKNNIAFYGNDILVSSFNAIYDKFSNASFNVKVDYDFISLKNDLQSKIDNDSLEYKLIFLFDEKANLDKSNYQDLINLLKNHEIYIVNISNNKLSFNNDNVKVIDFYEKIKDNTQKITINNQNNLEDMYVVFADILSKEIIIN